MPNPVACFRPMGRSAWRCFLLLAGFLVMFSDMVLVAAPSGATHERVGPAGGNRFVTPANQVLTPAGLHVLLPGTRPQALALSPDGKLLVVTGKTNALLVLDPRTGAHRQTVPMPSEKAVDPEPDPVSTHILTPDKSAQVSYTGLIFSPDGTRLYLANVNGSIKVFQVDRAGQVAALFTIPLPEVNAVGRKAEIPAGLAVSADGRRLYVVLNLSNQLAEMDSRTGKILRMWPVGVAPYDVRLHGTRAYVSNWGGRAPGTHDITGPAGRGYAVRVDGVRYVASEGSITVIDLAGNRVEREILTGRHASGLALSPEGRYLCVANAAEDTISVLETQTGRLVENFTARQNPADLFGAAPNALAFGRDGHTLYACNGSQNAVAVFDFKPGRTTLRGLIPVGWYPGAMVYDRHRDTLIVANIKGIGSGALYPPGQKEKYNSHQYLGSLSIVKAPGRAALAGMTRTALQNMRYPLLREAARPARPHQPPRPVPESVGEASVFKHVVYIIKENRTYDQVLGDMPEGRGNPELCIFGEKITPNHHALAREFVLLDNTYCSGILSADGHQWTDTGITTDYMEKSFAGFPRSYPDGMEDDDVDALAYSPAGFIWDLVLGHGKTFRSYGEFGITDKFWLDRRRGPKPSWLDAYRQFLGLTNGIHISSRPAIESLRGHLATNTVGWDMDIPDVFRAAQFIKELKEFECLGQFPHLVMICLPNDHTSGTKANSPTPAAYMADNDLALGQIVEAISHSRFWRETCIFVIEDDPQNGWDHISGYRTVAFVISPYTKRRAVVSTQYNQTSILRTIELILGLPPMNQLDATATPMFDCFTETPDFTPYQARPNNIALDELNPPPKRVANALLRRHAQASLTLPLEQVDRCPEDLLNRILWHAMKGPEAPYPTWAVRWVKAEDDD
ncbi:MAG: bifunctional YncE family protein/alkaline phosphatase family protein [Verrucomicrobiae bacterium]|nr:bifunctional YncE family protein/alkaline phosphatase family protein [Verrucomicrobiae bacterium]